MKHTSRNIAAALAGAILVSAALPVFAQQGPPGGGQRGQGGPGGQGGMRGQRGPDAGATILRQKKVQVHLKLTETQISQIMEILPPDRRGGMGGPGDQGGQGGQGGQGMGGQRGQGQGGQRGQGQGGQRGQGGGQGGGQGLGPRGQGGPGMGSPLDGPLKEIMGEAQFNRFSQLRLQFEGAVAVGRPDISQKLGITEDQQARIRQIMEQNRPTPPEAGQRPDPQAREAQRAAVNRMIESVLTSAQKVKWNELLGAKFEFERPQGPPPTL
jgi:hypothetical protein